MLWISTPSEIYGLLYFDFNVKLNLFDIVHGSLVFFAFPLCLASIGEVMISGLKILSDAFKLSEWIERHR